MLNINATKNESTLTLVLDGRLDTVTAPELQAAIDEQIDGISNIIMDCKDLAYISSAGLRVLLTARKSIQGDLILNNVTPSVRDVLEITGFVDILTIE
ncbi:MAG: STAS domain-containing protein [Clostridia bacterium]|nr:STAS domain-containing protein [Clostridia bacterium]MBQ4460176.1 STAS domain-containing protein [Clostridia bacterium]MBQ6445710.1 STAS domain-containing protein [Clostridia bacterium]MBQ6526270.1 STAS domain-containing protein [Clostridia bacterium]MBQ6784732.1 STAS domain-containing protein [Clostridia bacterium]